MAAPFSLLINLAELDSSYSQLSREEADTVEQISRLQEQKQQTAQELKHKQNTIHELKKRIDALDLELKASDAVLQKKIVTLAHLQNPREYQSIEQEIARLQEQRELYQEQIFGLWDRLEQAQKEFELSVPISQEQIHALDTVLAELDKQKNYVALRIEDYYKQRTRLTAQIDPELLTQYTAMRTHVTHPVVPVIRNACTGCFYSLTNAELQQLKAQGKMTCPDCFRFLYTHLQEL